MNQSSPHRRTIPAAADEETMATIQRNAHLIAESDPSRTAEQKLAVERGVIDAYNYGLQSSPRLKANEKIVVESYRVEEELDGFTAP